MTNIYTYEFNFGVGYVEKTVYNNTLVVKHQRNSDFIGIVSIYIEGSCDLLGDDFDEAIQAFQNYGSIPMNVKYNGSTCIGTAAYDLCNLDYKQRKCTLKNFNTVASNDFTLYMKKDVASLGAGSDLFDSLGVKITDNAIVLIDLIDTIFENLGVTQAFDPDDYWLNTGFATIDFDDLRIVQMVDCFDSGGVNVKGGGRKTINLYKIFNMLCTMFNITVVYDNGTVKFAKASDLISNTLDLSTFLTEVKTRNYDLNKLYRNEIIRFNDNNYFSGDVDNLNTELTYPYQGDTKENSLTEFTTLWAFDDDISSEGWFIGEANPVGEILRSETGYVSGLTKKNAHLFPANLLNTYYRDFINTDKMFFYVCGNASASATSYFKEFIEIPDIFYVTGTNPNVFYDSITLETGTGTERIGLVTTQETNLNTNITRFKLFEFYNDIDV